MIQPKSRIFWCSDSSFIPTGFSNQSIYIMRELSKNYEVFEWSHQYQGKEYVQMAEMGQQAETWMHLPAGYSAYGQGQLEPYIRKLNPKVVAWLCDSFMLTQQNYQGPRNDWVMKMIANIKRDKPDVQFVHYYPLDSDDIYQGLIEELSVMDYRVAMSKFARDSVKKASGLDSHYIPHCCDTNIFQPLSVDEKDRIRKNTNLIDRFVIGHVGRNQSRKMPYRLFYVMEEFCKDKNDVTLLCHFDPSDPQAGVNTKEIASNCGFKEVNYQLHRDDKGNEIFFTGMSWASGFPPNTLNEIYNAMDVHAMCTTGEGFGITTIEAMAAGLPNITTDYTSTKEILLDDGICGIPTPWNNFINGGLNTRRVLIDTQAFAANLQKYYDSDKLRQKHGQMGREKAVAFYSTQTVLPQWSKLYQEILEPKEVVRSYV